MEKYIPILFVFMAVGLLYCFKKVDKKLFFLNIMMICGLMLKAQEQPNIIFILTDDMGYGDLTCYNSDQIQTPNIDKLASEGTRFTQYYSPAPLCSPARTGLLTGNFPGEWNFTNFLHHRKFNARAEQANYLNPAATTLPRVLNEAGYVTAHVGKWHMGGGRDIKNAPKFAAYGYDEHLAGTYESPEPDPAITATDWIWSEEDNIKRWDRTKYFVDKTLDFLSRHKGEPCFVNLWTDDMHTPWVPHVEERYQGKFPMDPEEEKAFQLVLKEFDKQMGRLFEGIKKLGLEKNTIIVFTSDNGPMPSFRGSRAAGLRGTKMSLYEGGTRMPFIVKWLGKVEKGVVDSTSVLSGVDMLLTFANIVSAELPPNYKSDGEDVSEIFRGEKHQRKKSIYWEFGRNDYGFFFPKGRDQSPNLAIRSGDWKLLTNYNSKECELYNIKSDPNETNNIAKENIELVKEMQKEVTLWRDYLPELTPKRANP